MQKTQILVAGHDLKFFTHILNYYESREDLNVDVLDYSSHELPDTEHIARILPKYDIIFCEWGLGNTRWFSQNKLPGQKLIVRLHAFEFAKEYLTETLWNNVDRIILVAPYMKEKFDKMFPGSEEKGLVIPNLIDCDSFLLPKEENARFNLGLLGMVPRLKGPHRGLEILQELRKTDDRYRLFIKSRQPEEVAWLWRKPEEREYYTKFFNDIKKMGLKDAVIFEPHGSDVQEWFRKIGFILSLSDHEAFHVAVAEGMASGAIPVIRNWVGANLIYPDRFIFNEIPEAVSMILLNGEISKYQEESGLVTDFCRGHFSRDILLPEYDNLVRTTIDRGKIREKIKGIVSQQQAILDEKNKVVRENKQLKKEIGKLIEKNNSMKLSLNEMSRELKSAKKQLNNIQNSLSWKVGSFLVRKPAGLLGFKRKSKS